MWDQASIIRSRRLLLNNCTPSAAVRSLCTHLGLAHFTVNRTIRARYSDRFHIRHRKNTYTIHVPDRQPEYVFRSVLRGLATIEQHPPHILTWYKDFSDRLPLLLQQRSPTTRTDTNPKRKTRSAENETLSERPQKKASSQRLQSSEQPPTKSSDLLDRMGLFRRWERQEEERRLDPELAVRSMAAAQARVVLDPDNAYRHLQYKIVWSDRPEGAWLCQQTAPHRYTIFLNKEWLLAMVAMRATLTVGGVLAPTFCRAVLLLVLQAMTRILSRQAGADKAGLLRRSGLASLHCRLAHRPVSDSKSSKA